MADKLPWFEKMQGMENDPTRLPAIARTLGIHFVEWSAGRAVFSLKADMERHANPVGTMHGGVLVDLGDLAMGCAMGTTIEADESFTTIELRSNYFKPVWTATLRAEAKVIRRSRSLGYVECDVTDEGGSLVCKLSSTCMVLRGDAARGR